MRVTRRSTSFIRQFGGPGDTGIVCFRFWQAVVASGCPGECAYCFLQTQTPYRRKLYDLKGTLFDNLTEIVPEVQRWLKQDRPSGLIVGENQDGLAFERPYKKLLGITPLELLIPLFSRSNPIGHTLVVLSKFTTTEYAEALGPSPNVVFSWSLSLPGVSRRFEKKVAPLQSRLDAAARLKAKGWRVRFRLDALAPIRGWESDLRSVVEAINAVGPEMVTLGAMRASNLSALKGAAARNGRDSSIFDYVSDKDPSGFKHRVDPGFQSRAYQLVIQNLNPNIVVGLCKDDVSVWRACQLPWKGCNCLHGQNDPVVAERGAPEDLIADLSIQD